MISPTPGRIVWFYPSVEEGRDPNGQPLGAMVAKVLSDRCLNLTVSHGDGTTYARQSVQLLQDDDAVPETAYAAWMPYQKGQAAKHDQPAPAPDLAPVHAKIDELTASVQGRFEDFGAWLQTTFKDIEARLNEPARTPAPPAPTQDPNAAATLNSV
jgi:hypothetical protein